MAWPIPHILVGGVGEVVVLGNLRVAVDEGFGDVIPGRRWGEEVGSHLSWLLDGEETWRWMIVEDERKR